MGARGEAEAGITKKHGGTLVGGGNAHYLDFYDHRYVPMSKTIRL